MKTYLRKMLESAFMGIAVVMCASPGRIVLLEEGCLGFLVCLPSPYLKLPSVFFHSLGPSLHWIEGQCISL